MGGGCYVGERRVGEEREEVEKRHLRRSIRCLDLISLLSNLIVLFRVTPAWPEAARHYFREQKFSQ
jgi:hypothetical protein